MKSILLAFIGLSAGLTIGGALAAFVTLLDFIPRLIQLTNTRKYIVLYQNCFSLGGLLFSFLHFFDYTIRINKIISMMISFIMGIFTGLFSSALAEVLNVLPVLSKKFKLKHKLKYIIAALLLGKTSGALWYWLVFAKR
ncbi:MAG TPA: stage V sporulation protein AC [Tissierellia bacterium]|nr:stage V sporulation protein AC [Tissierellia bacterium]